MHKTTKLTRFGSAATFALLLALNASTTASAAYSVSTTATWTSGNTVTVTYSATSPSPAPPAAPLQDYIGLYAIGDPDGTYQAFKFIPAGVRNGSVTFTVPSTTGSYQVRYQSSASGFVAQASQGLTVNAPNGVYALINVPNIIDVDGGYLLPVGSKTATGAPAPTGSPTQDYVGLYVRSASDGSYLAFGLFPAGVNASTSFVVPASVPTGTYQLRYQPYWNGYVTVAKRWIRVTH